MSALTKKLFREVLLLRGQLIAIILVVICGIAVFVTFRSVHASLSRTQSTFYDEFKFADVFVLARRVPESVSQRIREIPGVIAIETRVKTEVLLDIPGVDEPASGAMISIPDHGQPLLNKLFLRNGRWVGEGADDEVIVSTAFADANEFTEGDTFSAVINGRKRKLTIVGRAISPEYVIELTPGSYNIDNKRYGTMWMARSALAAMYDMKGAFNDASLKLERGISEATVRDQVDVILDPYGSIGAIGREDQISNRMLTDEITQVRVQGVLIPTIFLGVAIFLLNIALMRLVSTQRMSIAILKAFGYSNTAIGIHYIGYALIATAVGAIIGFYLGQWLGVLLTEVYAKFFRFPILRFDVPGGVVATSIVIALGAAIFGALGAVRTVLKLPPAESMRPEAPKSFKAGLVEKLGLLHRLDPVTTMIWRTIQRRPLKSALSVLMISLAVGILIIGRSMFDMFDVIMYAQFNSAMRQDAGVAFVMERSSDAQYAVEHMPGVLRAEPYRMVPVDISNGRIKKRLAIQSIEPDQSLVRVINYDGKPVGVPSEGLVVTERLAEIMNAKIGDSITVQLLQGDRRVDKLVLSGTASEMFGLQAYMNRRALSAWLNEAGSVSGANVVLDPSKRNEFAKAVKETPMIASAMDRRAMIDSFNDNYKENSDISTFVIIVFAMVIAFGVVYNSARIALSERATELASLRILGFTSNEITFVLLGEQMLLLLFAIPVGMGLGTLGVLALPGALSTDLFRFPVVLTLSNYGISTAVILIVAVISGLLLRGKLKKLDLISVLKSRE